MAPRLARSQQTPREATGGSWATQPRRGAGPGLYKRQGLLHAARFSSSRMLRDCDGSNLFSHSLHQVVLRRLEGASRGSGAAHAGIPPGDPGFRYS